MYIHCEFTPTSQPVNPVKQDVGTSQTTQLFLSSGKTVVNQQERPFSLINVSPNYSNNHQLTLRFTHL